MKAGELLSHSDSGPLGASVPPNKTPRPCRPGRPGRSFPDSSAPGGPSCTPRRTQVQEPSPERPATTRGRRRGRDPAAAGCGAAEPSGARQLRPPQSDAIILPSANPQLSRSLRDARPDGRRGAPRTGTPETGRVEAMGAVRQRPRLGDRARGLQPDRRRLELLPPRPRPQQGLPLGRGRHRRRLRPLSAPRLRPGLLERPRPDPQGTPLRPRRPTRATTARTSRSTTSTSTPRRRIPT